MRHAAVFVALFLSLAGMAASANAQSASVGQRVWLYLNQPEPQHQREANVVAVRG